MKLSIVMPVYNEIGTIREIIRRVLAAPGDKELIIVDDCSTDGTREYLQQLVQAGQEGLKVLFQDSNQGKGAALRRGFQEVAGDIVIVQDADLEYDPAEYPTLVAPILQGKADVVYGSRFMSGPRRVLYFWHAIGNALLTLFSNMCTNLNLTDMETGFKAFRIEVIRRIQLRSDRFGFEPEITAKIARLRYRLYEVPVSYSGREYWEGKKIGWRDGLAAIWQIIRYSFFEEPSEKADVGQRTLEKLTRAPRYNQWVVSQVKPYLGPRVLEVGAGIGNLTRFLVNRELVMATDLNPLYLDALRKMFERCPQVQVRPFDLLDGEVPALERHRFTSVFSSNVLEHVDDDLRALRNLHTLLVPGGRIVLVLPSLMSLFGTLDEQLGHYRRYDRRDITQKLVAAGFEVEVVKYFNLPGIVGWYLNGRLLRRKIIPTFQLRLYDLLVPWLKLEERFELPCGMSMVVVGRKPARDGAVREPRSKATPAWGTIKPSAWRVGATGRLRNIPASAEQAA